MGDAKRKELDNPRGTERRKAVADGLERRRKKKAAVAKAARQKLEAERAAPVEDSEPVVVPQTTLPQAPSSSQDPHTQR